MYTCDNISLNALWNEKCCRKRFRENYNTNSMSRIFFFPENEIMWKNMVDHTDNNIFTAQACFVPDN